MFSLPDETIGEYEKRYEPAKRAHRDALRERRGASNYKLIDAAHRIAHQVTFPNMGHTDADRAREMLREASFRESYKPALEMHVVSLRANATAGVHERDRKLCLALCEAVFGDEGCGGYEYLVACGAAHEVVREALWAEESRRLRAEAQARKGAA
jgi:hypothetical protein